MMKKSVLLVARWKDLTKVRKFFENFLEAEHPTMQQYGMKLYFDYLRMNGKRLGGKFARIDASFAEHAGQHGR